MSRDLAVTSKRAPARTRGFTLIEVVVAIGLLVALCAGASMLVTLALATIDRSRQRTTAMVLARAKLEQLLGLTWSARDIGGTLVLLSDETTDTSRAPPSATGSGTLPSPPDALSTSRAGYVDYLDWQGQPVFGAAPGPGPPGPGPPEPAVPDAATYVRRWSIERRGSGAAEMLIVQVLVTPRGRSDRDAVWISGARVRRGA